MSGRLERSRTNRVISGVCGGIAEYLDIDATFVRVVMVILAFPFGVGILIYFVLLFLMPNPGEATPFVRSAGVDQTVAVDIVFLLGNVGAFRFVDWHYIWPLVLIALGVYLVAQRTRQ